MTLKQRCLRAGLLGLLLLPGVLAAADQVEGDIRFAPAREGVSWVGQELELNLELWSNAFSFGDQLFILPEVRGGFLLQADSSTIKLSETRGDVQWQGLRYTLLLYPQRAGQLEVPPFEVQFTARAGFGSEPALFQLETPELLIGARLPPGVEPGSLLVTTDSFTMDSSWSPPVPADGPLELKVGDALRLEVTRQAQDVPGMVFAPLPEFSIDGLAAYPDPPTVNDQVNRGSLTGQRTDVVTFICERSGHYMLPELRFQWWDPAQEVLSERVIASLQLDVVENPVYQAEAATTAKTRTMPDWRFLLGLMGALVALGYGLWRIQPYMNRELLSAKLTRLRSLFVRWWRRWIKAPNELPPLNPQSLTKG